MTIIDKDVTDAFKQLSNELQIHLNDRSDISGKREFLEAHVPKEVIYKADLLFETLLNKLMSQATTQLERADTKVQNKFYEADFRKKLHSWVKNDSNNLRLNPKVVAFSFDPRLKNGLMAGGVSLLFGTGATAVTIKTAKTASIATATVVTSTVVAMGFTTLVVSALAFKLLYDKAKPKALNQIKDDIEIFLSQSENQVRSWLRSIEGFFESELKAFLSSNAVKVS